jgi:hypothetical protein
VGLTCKRGLRDGRIQNIQCSASELVAIDGPGGVPGGVAIAITRVRGRDIDRPTLSGACLGGGGSTGRIGIGRVVRARAERKQSQKPISHPRHARILHQRQSDASGTTPDVAFCLP